MATPPLGKIAAGLALGAAAAAAPAATCVYVSNADSQEISVLQLDRDATTGALAPLQRTPVGKNPNWVEIVELP